jgi:hypothetical protein
MRCWPVFRPCSELLKQSPGVHRRPGRGTLIVTHIHDLGGAPPCPLLHHLDLEICVGQQERLDQRSAALI